MNCKIVFGLKALLTEVSSGRRGGHEREAPGGAVTSHSLGSRLWPSVHLVPPLVLGIRNNRDPARPRGVHSPWENGETDNWGTIRQTPVYRKPKSTEEVTLIWEGKGGMRRVDIMQRPVFKSHHSQPSDFVSLNLSFLFCKMGLIMIPTG